MHPRHGTLWRAAAALAATLAVCSALAARPDTRTPLQKSLDSLFYAGRYDTLRTLIPALIHDAEARGDSAALGRLAFQRGRVEITLGHQAIASRELDRAIRLTEAARDTVGLLPALNFKAFVLRDQNNVDAAMALFERELDLARRARVPVAEGNATLGLAYRDLRRGEIDRAQSGYRRAFALFQASGHAYSIVGGTSSMSLLFRAQGRPDSSRAWLERSLRLARAHRFPMHELWSLNSIGLMEADTGNLELSVRYFEAALAIGRRIGFDRGQALPLMNIALRLSFLGERDASEQALLESLEVCRRAGFTDLETTTTIALGITNLEAGNNHQAAKYFRSIVDADFVYRALDLSEAAYGLAGALARMDSVDQAARVLEPFVSPRIQAPDRTQQPYYEIEYADLLRRQGHVEEALRRAIAVREQADGAGFPDAAILSRFLESNCRRALGDLPGAAAMLAAAMDSVEASRSVYGAPEWREAYGDKVMNEVMEASLVRLDYPAEVPREQRIESFYDTLQRFRTRTLLERIHDPHADATPIEGALARPVTLSRLQTSVLQPGDLLLDFFTGANRTHLFAVTADSCRLVTLPGRRSRFASQVALYAEILSNPDAAHRSAYSGEQMRELQRTIGAKTLGAVADMVQRADHVIVAPDGFYAALPMGTLIADDGDAALVELKRVTEVPSASVLEWARGAGHAATGPASVIALADGEHHLRGAQTEVKALERRYKNVERVTVTPGVLDTLVERAAADRILHIAAHARVNDGSPWQSGFVLGDTMSVAALRTASRAPVLLRAWSIARARLPYQLAVLAGCETAGGRATNGEGVLGLTSAFLSAGVPVVVSSRWAVDDRVTATLMEHFYDRLAAGETVASALRGAQLQVRSRRETSHPFYWAGFAVVGDGSRTTAPEIAEKPWMTRWKLTAGAILAIGVAGWSLRRRRLPSRSAA